MPPPPSYTIRYLPQFKKDLLEIVDYISITLEAPQTALRFADKLEAAILTLRDNPRAHRIYRPAAALTVEYRILPVKNYLVFYVVLEDVVEIRRVCHKHRDFERIF